MILSLFCSGGGGWGSSRGAFPCTLPHHGAGCPRPACPWASGWCTWGWWRGVGRDGGLGIRPGENAEEKRGWWGPAPNPWCVGRLGGCAHACRGIRGEPHKHPKGRSPPQAQGARGGQVDTLGKKNGAGTGPLCVGERGGAARASLWFSCLLAWAARIEQPKRRPCLLVAVRRVSVGADAALSFLVCCPLPRVPFLHLMPLPLHTHNPRRRRSGDHHTAARSSPKISSIPRAAIILPRQGKMALRIPHPPRTPFLLSTILLMLLALVLHTAEAGFGMGDYRIDFDFLGGEGDLSPEQYVPSSPFPITLLPPRTHLPFSTLPH